MDINSLLSQSNNEKKSTKVEEENVEDPNLTSSEPILTQDDIPSVFIDPEDTDTEHNTELGSMTVLSDDQYMQRTSDPADGNGYQDPNDINAEYLQPSPSNVSASDSYNAYDQVPSPSAYTPFSCHTCYMMNLDQSPQFLKPLIPCETCSNRFHIDCIPYCRLFFKRTLMGDDLFLYKCMDCNSEGDKDTLFRLNLSWLDVIHLSLFNLYHLNKLAHPKNSYQFHWYYDVVKFIRLRWNYFWSKDISNSGKWEDLVLKKLIDNQDRFLKITDDIFTLADPEKRPTEYDTNELPKIGRLPELKLSMGGRILDYSRKRKRIEDTISQDSDNESVFEEGEEDHDALSAIPNHNTAPAQKPKSKDGGGSNLMIYPDLTNILGEEVKLSDQPTQSAPQVKIFQDGFTVSSQGGYRMCKASHGIEVGVWYYEMEVSSLGDLGDGMIRLGYSQISGDLQCPVGYDGFGYSMRGYPPTLFNCAVGKPMELGFGLNDIVGVLICLPAPNDKEAGHLLARRWVPGTAYRPFPLSELKVLPHSSDLTLISDHTSYTTPYRDFPILKNSQIVYFVNGIRLKEQFNELHLGKYYPALSLYRGSKAKLNFGPEFKYPPPKTWPLPNSRGELEQVEIKPISNLSTIEDNLFDI